MALTTFIVYISWQFFETALVVFTYNISIKISRETTSRAYIVAA